MKSKLYDAVSYGYGEPLIPFTLVKEFDTLDDVIIYIKQMDSLIKRQYYFVCDEESTPKFFIETEKGGVKLSHINGKDAI